MIGMMMTDELNKNFFKALGQIQKRLSCEFEQFMSL